MKITITTRTEPHCDVYGGSIEVDCVNKERSQRICRHQISFTRMRVQTIVNRRRALLIMASFLKCFLLNVTITPQAHTTDNAQCKMVRIVKATASTCAVRAATSRIDDRRRTSAGANSSGAARSSATNALVIFFFRTADKRLHTPLQLILDRALPITSMIASLTRSSEIRELSLSVSFPQCILSLGYPHVLYNTPNACVIETSTGTCSRRQKP